MFVKYQSDFFRKDVPQISRFLPEGCPSNNKVISSGRIFLKYQSDFFRKNVLQISKWFLPEECPSNIKVISSGRIFLKYQSDFFWKNVPQLSKWFFPEECPSIIKVIFSGRMSLKCQSDFFRKHVPEIYIKKYSFYSKLNLWWWPFIGYGCTDFRFFIIYRIGLCGFDNPMRDSKTEEIKRHVGHVSANFNYTDIHAAFHLVYTG